MRVSLVQSEVFTSRNPKRDRRFDDVDDFVDEVVFDVPLELERVRRA
jgi:hypothetical protein